MTLEEQLEYCSSISEIKKMMEKRLYKDVKPINDKRIIELTKMLELLKASIITEISVSDEERVLFIYKEIFGQDKSLQQYKEIKEMIHDDI